MNLIIPRPRRIAELSRKTVPAHAAVKRDTNTIAQPGQAIHTDWFRYRVSALIVIQSAFIVRDESEASHSVMSQVTTYGAPIQVAFPTPTIPLVHSLLFPYTPPWGRVEHFPLNA
jgi:hypothetical protein